MVTVREILRSLFRCDSIADAREAGRNPVTDLVLAGRVTREEALEACAADWLCAQCADPIANATFAVCDECWDEATTSTAVLVTPAVKSKIKSMAKGRKADGKGKKGHKKDRAT